MLSMIILALAISLIPVIIYLIYVLAVLFTDDTVALELDKYPDISVVIPTYNESEVIEHRIKNLVDDVSYPTNNIHVIVVDDGSSDSTVELAKTAFNKYGISGEVILKEQRSGTNVSVNLGVESANTDIVITTDADVVFEDNALERAIARLLSEDDIGAVCGELQPVLKKMSFTTGSEKAYRSVYGKMCTWESGLHSTYCFNGPLIALKKEAFTPIPENHGASDAGMALRIIRNGFRTVYEPQAKFYEYITSDLKQQRRQKIRRAARLLEATLYNKDMFSRKYGKFGVLVYPLRFAMFFIVPTTFFASVMLWSYVLSQIQVIYGILFVLLFFFVLISGKIRPNLLSSFIWHQLYLFVSLFHMFKDKHIWKAVEREKV